MSLIAQIDPPTAIRQAIETASKLTGAKFDYLVKTAYRESAFKPGAKAATSSAAGLFQFIENTWLGTLKEAGDSFGLGNYASKIRQVGKGRYAVSDPHTRSEILNLRYDPKIAAVMAGAFTQRNSEYLGEALGRQPSGGELYIAHFLGPGEGSRLIKAARAEPNAIARDFFPKAARANKPIFYDDGRPRSMAEVYRVLVQKHDAEVGASAVLAGGGGGETKVPVPPRRDEPVLLAAAAAATPAPAPPAPAPALLAQMGAAFPSIGSKPSAPWLMGVPPAKSVDARTSDGSDRPAASEGSGTARAAPGSIGTWVALVERAIADAAPATPDGPEAGKTADRDAARSEDDNADAARRSGEPPAGAPAQRRSSGVLGQLAQTGQQFGSHGFTFSWHNIIESA